jgi:hypothetical protein
VRNLHWVVSQHGPDVHSSATALTLVLPGQTCMQAQFEPLHAHTLPPPQPVSPEHMLISDWVLHAPQADTTNIAITAAKQIIAPAESPRQENSISIQTPLQSAQSAYLHQHQIQIEGVSFRRPHVLLQPEHTSFSERRRVSISRFWSQLQFIVRTSARRLKFLVAGWGYCAIRAGRCCLRHGHRRIVGRLRRRACVCTSHHYSLTLL